MATEGSRLGGVAGRSLGHVSDHADELDGLIAFASRGLDTPPTGSATRNAASAETAASRRFARDRLVVCFERIRP
jgi:hypothetical protein